MIRRRNGAYVFDLCAVETWNTTPITPFEFDWCVGGGRGGSRKNELFVVVLLFDRPAGRPMENRYKTTGDGGGGGGGDRCLPPAPPHALPRRDRTTSAAAFVRRRRQLFRSRGVAGPRFTRTRDGGGDVPRETVTKTIRKTCRARQRSLSPRTRFRAKSRHRFSGARARPYNVRSRGTLYAYSSD